MKKSTMQEIIKTNGKAELYCANNANRKNEVYLSQSCELLPLNESYEDKNDDNKKHNKARQSFVEKKSSKTSKTNKSKANFDSPSKNVKNLSKKVNASKAASSSSKNSKSSKSISKKSNSKKAEQTKSMKSKNKEKERIEASGKNAQSGKNAKSEQDTKLKKNVSKTAKEFETDQFQINQTKGKSKKAELNENFQENCNLNCQESIYEDGEDIYQIEQEIKKLIKYHRSEKIKLLKDVLGVKMLRDLAREFRGMTFNIPKISEDIKIRINENDLRPYLNYDASILMKFIGAEKTFELLCLFGGKKISF